MSSDLPKSNQEKKTSPDEVPDEVDVGFASGLEDETVESVWDATAVAELKSLQFEFTRLQQPKDRNTYQVPTGDFIDRYFPGLSQNDFIGKLREISDVMREIGAGQIPASTSFTPRLMREYYDMAIPILRLNEKR